jgi:inner membrane transporter RhtA
MSSATTARGRAPAQPLASAGVDRTEGSRATVARYERGPAARVPAEALFVAGAVSQYVGAAVAVLLFDVVSPAALAWLRVASAAVALAVWRRPWRRSWARPDALLVAGFGSALALMNLTFYLALDRLPLGTAVAIEFVGPIAVAAAGSRTRSDWLALALAGGGVVLLADAQRGGSLAGVALVLIAAAFWALYIVLGHRVAARGLGVSGLAAGMAAGTVLIAPIGIPAAGDTLLRPDLLLACVAVGLFSSVVPYALDQVALRRLTPARFALLLALLPVTATVTGAIILDQVPGVAELAGIGMVAVSVALARGPSPAPADEAEAGA